MRLLFSVLSFAISVGVSSQTLADPKCISMMNVPLEGPDSVFLPALESVGFVQVQPEEPEPDTVKC